jgi:hypothetical protein
MAHIDSQQGAGLVRYTSINNHFEYCFSVNLKFALNLSIKNGSLT